MKFTIKQAMEYDAYIADTKGNRLYTFTKEDKESIIDSLCDEIDDNISYSNGKTVDVFFDYTTRDGKHNITIDLAFNGKFYRTEDWDTGYQETKAWVSCTDIYDCVCYPSDDPDVDLNCDTLLDMIVKYFTNLNL